MPPEPPGPPLTFAELVTQHEPMLQRLALRLTGNPQLARDLVQETLERALRKREQLQPGANLAAWLTTILTHLFHDHLKHQNVEIRALPDLAAVTETAWDPTLRTITDAELHAAIAALEPELREVTELCYLQQMRYHEAAAKLGAPIGTIGTRLRRARLRLLELLTPPDKKS